MHNSFRIIHQIGSRVRTFNSISYTAVKFYNITVVTYNILVKCRGLNEYTHECISQFWYTLFLLEPSLYETSAQYFFNVQYYNKDGYSNCKCIRSWNMFFVWHRSHLRSDIFCESVSQSWDYQLFTMFQLEDLDEILTQHVSW